MLGAAGNGSRAAKKPTAKQTIGKTITSGSFAPDYVAEARRTISNYTDEATKIVYGL